MPSPTHPHSAYSALGESRLGAHSMGAHSAGAMGVHSMGAMGAHSMGAMGAHSMGAHSMGPMGAHSMGAMGSTGSLGLPSMGSLGVPSMGSSLGPSPGLPTMSPFAAKPEAGMSELQERVRQLEVVAIQQARSLQEERQARKDAEFRLKGVQEEHQAGPTAATSQLRNELFQAANTPPQALGFGPHHTQERTPPHPRGWHVHEDGPMVAPLPPAHLIEREACERGIASVVLPQTLNRLEVLERHVVDDVERDKKARADGAQERAKMERSQSISRLQAAAARAQAIYAGDTAEEAIHRVEALERCLAPSSPPKVLAPSSPPSSPPKADLNGAIGQTQLCAAVARAQAIHAGDTAEEAMSRVQALEERLAHLVEHDLRLEHAQNLALESVSASKPLPPARAALELQLCSRCGGTPCETCGVTTTAPPPPVCDTCIMKDSLAATEKKALDMSWLQADSLESLTKQQVIVPASTRDYHAEWELQRLVSEARMHTDRTLEVATYMADSARGIVEAASMAAIAMKSPAPESPPAPTQVLSPPPSPVVRPPSPPLHDAGPLAYSDFPTRQEPLRAREQANGKLLISSMKKSQHTEPKPADLSCKTQ